MWYWPPLLCHSVHTRLAAGPVGCFGGYFWVCQAMPINCSQLPTGQSALRGASQLCSKTEFVSTHLLCCALCITSEQTNCKMLGQLHAPVALKPSFVDSLRLTPMRQRYYFQAHLFVCDHPDSPAICVKAYLCIAGQRMVGHVNQGNQSPATQPLETKRTRHRH